MRHGNDDYVEWERTEWNGIARRSLYTLKLTEAALLNEEDRQTILRRDGVTLWTRPDN